VAQQSTRQDADLSVLKAWDGRRAPEMFWMSVMSLFFLAGVLHLNERSELRIVFLICLGSYVVTYPAIWVEAIWAGERGSQHGIARWIYCLLPPLRLGGSDHTTGQNIWLPGLGWQPMGYQLEQRLERVTSVPMVILALLVLPLILAEHFWEKRLEEDPWLSGILNGVAGLIWLAFAAEFIIRLSISRNKWGYVKSHIVDLAIVILPFFSFLQALRLGRLMRLQQIAKTARIYRLRGVALRAWRALLLFDAVSRILQGPPAKRLAKMKIQLEHMEEEMDDLRRRIRTLENELSTAEDSTSPLQDN